MARVHVGVGTFINVIADHAVATVPNVADTVVAAIGVGTLRIGVTIVVTSRALVYIDAVASIASVSVVALTVVTVFSVCTGGLVMTFVSKDTFVNIFARHPVAKAASEALACITALCVSAACIAGALVVTGTFVDVVTYSTVSIEPWLTVTVEAVVTVDAVCVLRT